MKAYLRSVRIAPKKAQLVAKMVRGLSVNAALQSLQKTNKKAARILEKLLASAVTNARTNEGQDPNVLIIESLVVNKAQALDRGVPMARGRVRPMRKFFSHINLVLGIEGVSKTKKSVSTKNKSQDSASQATKKTVKSVGTAATKQPAKSTKGSSSTKKDTTASRSTSVRSNTETKK